MSQFLASLLKWALALGLMGMLPQATKYFLKEAIEAHQKGPISFVKMNQALWGKTKTHKRKK